MWLINLAENNLDVICYGKKIKSHRFTDKIMKNSKQKDQLQKD